MIRGWFERGSPLVRGLLSLPSLGVSRDIPFLVDTGSEATCVMPLSDVDYSQLKGKSVTIWGASGFIEATGCRASILFTEDDGTYRLYDVDVVVMPDQENLRGTPSLVGQNILSRWRVLHEPAAGALLATVLSADWTVRPP